MRNLGVTSLSLDKLEIFVKKFPGFSLASEKDNDEILALFEKQSFGSDKLRLRYNRSPDFFEFLRYQSEKSAVILFRDIDRSLIGLGTLGLRNGYWDGHERCLAYFGDLRRFNAPPDRLRWRNFLAELLKELKSLYNCEIGFASIIDDNEVARRSLVDNPRGEFCFSPLTSYKMLNIFAPKFWNIPTLPPKFRIINWQSSKQDAKFLSFLHERQKHMPFGWKLDAESFSFWSGRRKNFNREAFTFVVDQKANPLMAAALWSPDAAKSIVVEQSKYNPILSKLLRLPRAGAKFSVSYLTHFVEDPNLVPALRAKLRSVLVQNFYERNNHRFLSLIDYPSLNRAEDLKKYFILQEIPMTLYSIHNSENKIDDRLKHNAQHGTGFELSLV